MTAKILKIFLMISVILVISGCAVRPVYVDRVVEVPVITKCKVPKPESCGYGKSTYTQEVNQMRLCIRDYKRLVKICE